MTIDQQRRALRILLALAAFGAAAALGASAMWSVEAMADGAPLKLFGLTPTPCTGCVLCGMSRAFTAMSHGEPARALEFNPLVALFYPAAWALIAAALVSVVRIARPLGAAARS